MKEEIRSIDAQYKSLDDNRIEGYAIVFNSQSEVLMEGGRRFVEVILPEAVTDELIQRSDIIFTFNHNADKILARSKYGDGTLKMEKDDYGLRFSFEVPNTTLGNDISELIKRGDLQSCSFAFIDDDVEWDFTNKELPTRFVKSIAILRDLSCVVSPAYSQTSIEARSLDEKIEEIDKAEKDKEEEELRKVEEEIKEYKNRI